MEKYFRTLRQGIFAIAVLAFVLSCGGKTKSKATESGSTGAPSTPPVASAAKPFALKLFTQYDDTTYVNQLTFNETGTDECSVTAAAPVATCTVEVPEGRLYFSSLNFQYSWVWEECKLLHFAPYYYMADNTAAYFPPQADSSVDCTAAPIPTACFGGAAVDLVPGFPSNRTIIHLPDENVPLVPLTFESEVRSAYSHKYSSNRWTVNDLDPLKIGMNATPADLGGQGDGYIANSYVNYTFYCRDDWYDPVTYTVNLVVKDVDTNGAGPNDYFTWKEWP